MEELIIEPIELPKAPIDFHPEFTTKDGKDYVILPKEEFLLALRHLEDYEDHYAIEEARRENANKPSISHEEFR
ncbi:MAG: type II toxin-antitoxin system Phd/YefM family antitoxin [bacterium]